MAFQNTGNINKLQDCDNMEQFYHYANLTKSYVQIDDLTILSTMGCQIRCKTRVFTMKNHINQRYIKADDCDHIKADDCDHIKSDSMDLAFFYSDGNVESIEHVPTYDANSLFGDIGGSLGLLMGYSVLGFYVGVERLVSYSLNKIMRQQH